MGELHSELQQFKSLLGKEKELFSNYKAQWQLTKLWQDSQQKSTVPSAWMACETLSPSNVGTTSVAPASSSPGLNYRTGSLALCAVTHAKRGA
ncbi:hypothetical protein QTO34_015884 [Cnephaeus nilssonii]|uniref:Uncharacterized protein n=1 Tax=Cnephaeus nilssonii TaxID=3371016 RepID=A0AA40LR52_CNENI|nr:hypothetical protein QTO34_015884 [Eptesicus nilssonii]